MIKDNHVDACGGVAKAIRKVKGYLLANDKELEITVEVRNFDELKEAMQEGGIRRIMLDNFDLDQLRQAVEIIGDEFESEASGGITYESLRMVAETGVGFISVGALTHSAGSMDMSLKVIV
jgi:nicotinate-nucleotide pyrophosphorylase (carboxylating)